MMLLGGYQQRAAHAGITLEDVEHIAIVGVDAKGKVTGLYVN